MARSRLISNVSVRIGANCKTEAESNDTLVHLNVDRNTLDIILAGLFVDNTFILKAPASLLTES